MDGAEAKKAADKIRRLASPALQQTLNETVRILGENGIPSLVVGGVAVQEYGYPRSTVDVDLVVPDPQKAQEILLTNGFTLGNFPLTVLAPNSVEVDLLKAGDRMNLSKVSNPIPTAVTTSPQFCDLADLIDLKIGSYLADAASGGVKRYHDRTDVMKLIQSRELPRDFLQGKIQQAAYEQLWDFLNNPKPQKEASIVDLYPEKSYTGSSERGTMKLNTDILASELTEVAGVKTSDWNETNRGTTNDELQVRIKNMPVEQLQRDLKYYEKELQKTDLAPRAIESLPAYCDMLKAEIKSRGKKARMLVPEENGTTPALQRMVGDPDDQVTSPFTQFKPNPGNMQLPNPLSPVQGDDVFFAYLISGARFQAHDGSWWDILDYNFQNFAVEIANVWYPRIHAVVNVSDIRRSIHSWIEPIQVLVPPAPPGIEEYDVQKVRIVK